MLVHSTSRYLVVFALLASMLGTGLGCAKKDEDGDKKKSKKIDLPLITPLVEQAMPGTLVLSLRNGFYSDRATGTEAAEALKDYFADQVQSISGQTKAGWLNAYINDLDTRIAETNNSSVPTCLGGTAVDVDFEMGTAAHDLTLKLQCVRSFESPTDQSGSGSGMAYGRVDEFDYVYLMLAQKSNGADKFGYAAIVNRTTSAVQLLFLQNHPTWERTTFFHLETTPSPKRLEMVVAGSSDGVGPVSTATTHVLAPGSRLVGNETHIRAEGTVATSTGSDGVASGTTSAFDADQCFDATDLTKATAACGSDAPAFDLPLVTAAQMVAAKTTVDASLKTMQALVGLGVGADVPPPGAQ